MVLGGKNRLKPPYTQGPERLEQVIYPPWYTLGVRTAVYTPPPWYTHHGTTMYTLRYTHHGTTLYTLGIP